MSKIKITINLIKSVKEVYKFIESSKSSKSSANNKLRALAHFYLANKIDLKKMILIAKKEQLEKVPFSNTKLKIWLDNYEGYLKKSYSENTQKLWINYVRKFFSNQKIELKKKDNFYPIIKKQDTNRLTKQDIERLLDASKNMKMKAIILTQISSGLAPKILLNLKIKDFEDGIINENVKLCKFNLKRSDGGYFTVFISTEALEAIEQYLKFERKTVNLEDPLFSRNINGKNKLSIAGLEKAYRELNNRIDWSHKNITNFKVTPNVASNFFKMQMKSSISKPILNYFMGKENVLNIKENSLVKIYTENMELVTIHYLNLSTLRTEYYDIKKKFNETWELVNTSIEFLEEEVNPNEELFEDYKHLSEAFSGINALNETNERYIKHLEEQINELKQELNDLKSI